MLWEFRETPDGRWYWRCHEQDGLYTNAIRTFDTRSDCVADAFDHGYLSLHAPSKSTHLADGLAAHPAEPSVNANPASAALQR